MNRSASRSAERAVPCLNSNNCIETANSGEIKQLPSQYENRKADTLNEFSTSYKKSTTALEMNVKAFIEAFGLNKVGFLTLTFADDVTDPKEAQRRFHSLRTNFLKRHFSEYVCVYERTKKGRIHFHLIVNTRVDIRRGLNFREIAAGRYSSANPALRQLWALLRENVQKYGFGRTELLPVKTNSKGLARYVSKYISKHINSRLPEDKGYRLVRTSMDKKFMWKVANSNFAFVSRGSKEWRRKLKKWIEKVESYLNLVAEWKHRAALPRITQDNYNTVLAFVLRPKWAFKNRETIINMA
ncbi:rolling circle replication-associated protein [Neisseria cinerea]|uniref:rolling circle replication-associated protein n=1 Tax=Neisseria cinerea TaxID=483 RepID=UPI0027DF70AC|nr:phasyl DNA replicon protein arp [Neisseria cinerea]